jgi:hypothetical protein
VKYQARFIVGGERFLGNQVEFGEKTRRARKYVFALIGKASSVLIGRVKFQDEGDEVLWIGNRLAGLHDYLHGEFLELSLEEIAGDEGRSLYQLFRSTLEGPGAFEWIEECSTRPRPSAVPQ